VVLVVDDVRVLVRLRRVDDLATVDFDDIAVAGLYETLSFGHVQGLVDSGEATLCGG